MSSGNILAASPISFSIRAPDNHANQDSLQTLLMDTDREIVIALRRILRVTDADSRRIARQTGLSTSQFLVLQFVQRDSGVTVGRIAQELSLQQTTVTALLERLEARGLVQRQRNAHDRRKVEVTIAGDAPALLDDGPQLLQQRLVERLAELPAWERTSILAALQKLAYLLGAENLPASAVLASDEVVSSGGALDRTDPAGS